MRAENRKPKKSSNQPQREIRGFGKPTSSSSSSVVQKSAATAEPQTLRYRGLQDSSSKTAQLESAQDTERRIQAALSNLSPNLSKALQLKQRIARWESQTQGMSIVDQASVSTKLAAEMRACQQELDGVLRDNSLTEWDMCSAFQVATWDAVADTRAAKHDNFLDNPTSVSDVMSSISRAAIGKERHAASLRILDVGCGTGILISFLETAGVQTSNIFGIDLSGNMLKGASEKYPTATFRQYDFLQWNGVDTDSKRSEPLQFDTVCLHAVLHHLPDVSQALDRASRLLAPGGRVVISHPKGMNSVIKQHFHNHLLVPTLMPSIAELKRKGAPYSLAVVEGESVVQGERYIAVLEKV